MTHFLRYPLRMLLRHFVLLGLASVVVSVASACTAEIEEACLGGQCSPNTTSSSSGSTNASSSSSSSGLACEMTPETGDFPCDVFTVLNTKCHACHQDPPKANAPYSLRTFEDTRQLSGMTQTPRWQRIGAVIEQNTMPPNGSMTPQDKQTLLDWVAACAPPAADAMGCE